MKISSLFILVSTSTTAYAFSPPVVHQTRLQRYPPTSTISTSLSFFNKKAVEEVPEPIAIAGVGEEGCALPSLSGVNTLSEPIQAAIVLGIFAALGVSSVAFSSFLDTITLKYEWVQSWRYTWPLLGVVYAAAGVTHFTLQEQYENIYPSKGSWGIWYLPGSPEFHVKWTGVAEILGGVGLLIGGAYDAFMPVSNDIPNVFTSAGIGSDAAGESLLSYVYITCILKQYLTRIIHITHMHIMCSKYSWVTSIDNCSNSR